jgi:hypothetical protein
MNTRDTKPVKPGIAGEWWRLVAPPKLEQYDRPGIEAVDFTIYQAADGMWQLVSCLRHTAFPGETRLFYRWESPNLTDTNWAPRGIFWTTKAELHQAEGRLQAPYCVRELGRYHMFHNSNGAFCLVSDDGKNFTQHKDVTGAWKFFDMPRDVMIFDNRSRDGLWYAFYTDIVAGKYPDRQDHTVSFRTAKDLNGPWSADQTDVGVVTPGKPGNRWNFVNAESPFIVYRDGWYYRFEQMNVLASRDVQKWDVPILTCLTGTDAWGFIAPEIIEHHGDQYIAAYKYNEQRNGIYMARLVWEE